VTLRPQPPLALPMGAVEELELVPVLRYAHLPGEPGDAPDEPIVVGGKDRVQARLPRRWAEYHPCQCEVAALDGDLPLMVVLRAAREGALHQADRRRPGQHAL